MDNVNKEYGQLIKVAPEELGVNSWGFQTLVIINSVLWNLEKELRVLEEDGQLGQSSVFLSTLVRRYNAMRASVKKMIDIKTHSNLTEEKNYKV